MVWNSATGQFFVSASYNDPNWANSVILVDPTTGKVQDSIPIGSAPGKLALSGDDQYLYVAVPSLGVVRRFHLPSHTPDFDIPVATVQPYRNLPDIAIAALPSQPASVLASNGAVLAVYDGAVARPQTAPFVSAGGLDPGASLYAASGGGLYAYYGGVVSVVTVTSAGASIASSMPAFPRTPKRA